MVQAASDSPALGILELSLIARGMVVADALLKRAEVDLFASRPVSSGKYLLFLRGTVAEVEESMLAGRQAAGNALVDTLELPWAHDQLWALLPDPVTAGGWETEPNAEAVAIVETSTVCASVHAADAAAKAAEVTIRDMRLAAGIAGKAFFTMSGALAEIEAGAEAARGVAGGRLLQLEIIAQPAPEILGRLIF